MLVGGIKKNNVNTTLAVEDKIYIYTHTLKLDWFNNYMLFGKISSSPRQGSRSRENRITLLRIIYNYFNRLTYDTQKSNLYIYIYNCLAI